MLPATWVTVHGTNNGRGRSKNEIRRYSVQLDDELIENDWKPTWKKVKSKLQEGVERKRVEAYETKEQQGRLFREQEEECNLWLTQSVNPRKTASVMVMLEQMVETRAWKAGRGLIENGRCREVEPVEHLVAGCKVLANTEYRTRHNRAVMIMAVAWAKEHELIRTGMIWYEERWKRGTVIENDKAKLLWGFKFNLRKTTTSKRTDLILEEKEMKIWFCDMACPQQHNIETKRLKKLTEYRQLAFEMRERRLMIAKYIHKESFLSFI